MVFALVALIAVLVAWAVTSGGGGSGKGSSAPTGSHSPAATITAGPAPSGTHISGRPGGRDTAPADGGAGSSGGDTGSDAGADGGAGDGNSAGTTGGASSGSSSGSSAGATDGSSSGASAGAGTGGASAGTGSGGDQVPVGSTLPDCAPGTVTLSLTSAQNSYAPGETPVFQLHAANSGSVTCKLDFGPRSAVFTVTKTPDDSHVWATDDCGSASPYLLQVPAHGATTYTLRWNGKTSSPHCATPKGAQAAPGNYLAQARLPGYGAKSVPFVLSQD